MLLSIIIIIFLFSTTMSGYYLGFTRRVLQLVWFLVTLVVASSFNQQLSNLLWPASSNATAASTATSLGGQFISFFLILIIGRIIGHVLFGGMYHKKSPHGVISFVDHLLGGVVSLIIGYFFVYLILSMLNALQFDWFINQVVASPVARFIIYQTPGLTQVAFNWIFNIKNSTALQL